MHSFCMKSKRDLDHTTPIHLFGSDLGSFPEKEWQMDVMEDSLQVPYYQLASVVWKINKFEILTYGIEV